MSEQPKYRVEIFWSEEDGGYIANVPELKYTSAFGETREEALREVLVAEELHLETLEELGRPIPDPDARPVEAAEISLAGERTGTISDYGIDFSQAKLVFEALKYQWAPVIRETRTLDDDVSLRIVEDDFLEKLSRS